MNMAEPRNIIIWWSEDMYDGPGWVMGYEYDGEKAFEPLEGNSNEIDIAISDARDALAQITEILEFKVIPVQFEGKIGYRLIPGRLAITKRLHKDGGGFKIHIDK